MNDDTDQPGGEEMEKATKNPPSANLTHIRQHHDQKNPPSTELSTESASRGRGGWRNLNLDTRLMVLLTGAIALAAIVSAVIATCQLNILQRQLDTAERAWVTVRDVKITTISGRPANVQIIYRNNGKTPARQLAVNAKIFPHIGEPETVTACPISPRIEGSVGVLGPGDDGNLPAKIPDFGDKVFAAMNNGEAILVVCGKMKYLDIFDSPHQTSFCHFYRAATKQTFFCPIRNGNDAT